MDGLVHIHTGTAMSEMSNSTLASLLMVSLAMLTAPAQPIAPPRLSGQSDKIGSSPIEAPNLGYRTQQHRRQTPPRSPLRAGNCFALKLEQ